MQLPSYWAGRSTAPLPLGRRPGRKRSPVVFFSLIFSCIAFEAPAGALGRWSAVPSAQRLGGTASWGPVPASAGLVPMCSAEVCTVSHAQQALEVAAGGSGQTERAPAGLTPADMPEPGRRGSRDLGHGHRREGLRPSVPAGGAEGMNLLGWLPRDFPPICCPRCPGGPRLLGCAFSTCPGAMGGPCSHRSPRPWLCLPLGTSTPGPISSLAGWTPIADTQP